MKNTSNARFINLLLEELNYHHAEITKMEAILKDLTNLPDPGLTSSQFTCTDKNEIPPDFERKTTRDILFN